MWNVVVWCAHVDVAVVAYDQGLIGIPLAGPRSKIVPGPCTTVGRLHPLTRGLLVVSLLHISCGWLCCPLRQEVALASWRVWLL